MNHAMSGSRAEAAERRGNRGERRKRQIPVAMEHRKRERVHNRDAGQDIFHGSILSFHRGPIF